MEGKFCRFLQFIKQKLFDLFSWIKWKKKILLYLLKWAIVLGFILIIFWLIALYDATTDIAIALSASVIIIILTTDLLNLMWNINCYFENKRLSKPSSSIQNINLYRWSAGVGIDERFFYQILAETNLDDPIKNLNSIKKKIKKACSGNISNLKLLRIYIERNISNNIFEKFNKVSIGILIPVFTSTLNKATSSKTFISTIKNIINGSEGGVTSSHITTTINYTTNFFIMFIFLAFLWNVFTRNKRLLKLINEIIEISITEIEAKKNRSSSKNSV
ncbi:hypothetical protein [Bacillus chungangensis]|uniref:MotA/TolQ/ExbB proton channel domain-containing protein n=1 Tax=Bacillus chungangensis TaxID=587633 RepID=A0ABT9WTD1_9BACI|nr:hypothetical protein [Bacillus chungangensis]MDQ0176010.1 hypothetical protein [Bacillus chungangensis]